MTTSNRRRPRWVLCLMAAVCVCATAALPGGVAERGPARKAFATTSTAPASATTEARVIVKYRADSSLMRALSAGSGAATGTATAAAAAPQHAQAMSARLGITLTDGRAVGARAQVLRASGLSSQALADRLAAESDVEYAVVDGVKQALAAPNDPLYGPNQTTATPPSGQWYLRAPTSATIVDPTSVVSAINAEAAWNVTTGSANVVVAVLDTGVRRDHPDLTAKLLAGYDFISNTSISNDGDGRDADPSDPGDFGTTGTPPVTASSSWHGTQTAGLIGAQTNNGIGMASVGRDVMLLPVRVLGIGGGYDSDILAGMLWAGGVGTDPIPNPTPAKVINMSLGSAEACSQAYTDRIAQLTAAGVVVVAAAGNDGLKVGSPASCAGVIAVAGVRHAGTKVGYSDLGPEVAIAAPAGNCVNATPGSTCLFPLLTTSNSGTTTPVSNAAGGSIYTDGAADPSLGTSFSAPLVSGTVGLMLSANPSLTPSQVLSYLKSTVRPFPATGGGTAVTACIAPTTVAQSAECYCTTSTCGAGLLDAGAAVALAASGVPVANITAQTRAIAGGAFALSATSSRASALNAGIQTYAWSILSGASIASFSGATNASTATINTSAAGSVVVGLTVTDTVGKAASSAAVLTAASPTIANIVASANAIVSGGTITLDGSSSVSSTGTVSSYQWSITSGSTLVSFSGAANTPTVSVVTKGPGMVVVSLTVTDSLGQAATSTQTLTVNSPPSSGGGGGAVDPIWLLGLLVATVALAVVRPRRR